MKTCSFINSASTVLKTSLFIGAWWNELGKYDWNATGEIKENCTKHIFHTPVFLQNNVSEHFSWFQQMMNCKRPKLFFEMCRLQIIICVESKKSCNSYLPAMGCKTATKKFMHARTHHKRMFQKRTLTRSQ